MTNYIKKETDTEITIEGSDIASGSLIYLDNEIQVDYTGAKVMYKSDEETSNWTLAQFHFHAPSEHRINGETFDLEMHNVFVNDADSNQLLVVGVIYKENPDEKDNDDFLTALDMENLIVNPTTEPIDAVPLKNFYEKLSKKAKYNYKGSLTTPLCTESVEWFIIEEIQEINSVQLERFTSKWAGLSTFAGGSGSNRQTMDLNRRQVFLTRSKNEESK